MPLLMIPGPIEISRRVALACSAPPQSHLAPSVIEDFGSSLEKMREVWLAPKGQPFIVPGSGTNAMEMAANNLLDAGDHAVVVWTGYFSDRMAEMLRRRGVEVTLVGAEPGDAPSLDAIRDALVGKGNKARALFVTHVDTSTGVRVDARSICELARAQDVMTVFDGVCATGAERFEMDSWGADVYLTASQKAIGLPPGLALLVASERALAARRGLRNPPPLSVDFEAWLPIMKAYEERKPAYFATPPTTLLPGLRASLEEILERGMEKTFANHAKVATAMRAAFRALELGFLPAREELEANTLSAIYYPEGVGPELVGEVAKRGVVLAGGLLPALRLRYFRVGHMGDVIHRKDALIETVRAIGESLTALKQKVDVTTALTVLEQKLG